MTGEINTSEKHIDISTTDPIILCQNTVELLRSIRGSCLPDGYNDEVSFPLTLSEIPTPLVYRSSNGFANLEDAALLVDVVGDRILDLVLSRTANNTTSFLQASQLTINEIENKYIAAKPASRYSSIFSGESIVMLLELALQGGINDKDIMMERFKESMQFMIDYLGIERFDVKEFLASSSLAITPLSTEYLLLSVMRKYALTVLGIDFPQILPVAFSNGLTVAIPGIVPRSGINDMFVFTDSVVAGQMTYTNAASNKLMIVLADEFKRGRPTLWFPRYFEMQQQNT